MNVVNHNIRVQWSHSSIELFRQCPRRYFETKVAKSVNDDYSGTAAEWGNKVHKAMERRVMYGSPLPANMVQYEPLAARLEKLPGEKMAEQKFALNANHEPVDYFAKDVWVRIIIDLLVIHPSGTKALVLDYKTGKRKDDDRQLALCAAGVFDMYPEVQTVTSGYVWMGESEGKLAPATFIRQYADRLWNLYVPHVERIVEATAHGDWPEKPTGLCNGWCPVKQCQHWQPKRRR